MSFRHEVHDCGAAGGLTVPQIAERVGVSEKAIYFRIRKLGLRGADLLQPRSPRGRKTLVGKPAERAVQELPAIGVRGCPLAFGVRL